MHNIKENIFLDLRYIRVYYYYENTLDVILKTERIPASNKIVCWTYSTNTDQI